MAHARPGRAASQALRILLLGLLLAPAAQAASKPALTAADRQLLASLRAPVLNPVVTSPFGNRLNPVRRVRAFHSGVDYGAPDGTPVYAAQGGTIVALARTAHSGLFVRIRHNRAIETFYGHLSRAMPGLKAGSVLRAGDVLGFVGSSGFATGPHLHYELIVNGTAVNPELKTAAPSWLSLR